MALLHAKAAARPYVAGVASDDVDGAAVAADFKADPASLREAARTFCSAC